MAVAEPIEKNDVKVKFPYNLILLDDDDHTDKYVIHMCQTLFGHPVEKGIMIAKEVHVSGRAIIFSGSLEVVELKQEQVHAFGPDEHLARSQGSMTAIIEKV